MNITLFDVESRKSMEKKKKLRTGIALVLTLVILTAGGYLGNMFGIFCEGNYKENSIKHAQTVQDSPLRNKTVLFLGSSVTWGHASFGISFADLLEKTDGIVAVKEAVSGTTLVDTGRSSYVSRLKTMDRTLPADVFVCQLSTNDATKKMPLGAVSDSSDLCDFDTQTVAGAIEYIIAYAKSTWNCPVVFYTQAKYDSEEYAAMVQLLLQIREKWNISVLDLWNDAQFNDLTQDERKLYLADAIHPTQAGYKDWWLPKFRDGLCGVLCEE